MRKTRVFVAVTTAAVAASVCAFASEQENKKAEDAYLILDLEKAGIEELQKKDDNGEAYGTYLDLAASDHDGYTVNGIYSDEPVIAQFLALNESLADYEAAGIYEIIYDVPANADETDTADSPDVNEYHLELAMKENSTVFHYGIVEGELVKTPLQASFGEYAQPTCGLYSDTNHWLVIHLKASETADTENESGEKKSADEAVQTTSAASESTPETKPASTTAPSKAPETKPAPTTTPTKAPETTAPTTTAHTHTWVPVTNTVHHDATYKTVWVQDSAAWDETVVTKDAWDENVLVQDAWDEPTYSWVAICNECGHVFSAGEDVNEHMAAGCWSSWHHEQRQTGSVHHEAVYNTVHHDAVYSTVHHEAETTVVHHEATGHNEQVVDQAAWDEDVVTGYKCSGCGATK